jgi:hypothetical protein
MGKGSTPKCLAQELSHYKKVLWAGFFPLAKTLSFHLTYLFVDLSK